MKKPPAHQNTQKTVLLVDDDHAVLDFVSKILLDDNYNVLSAISAQEGLKLAKDCKGTIDLLLSDFQMPGMNGIDLATAISLDRPLIKVLMMSGFRGGMLILNEGWHFLPRPFIPSQLRTLIDGLLAPDRDSKFQTSPAV